ncbi:MAG: metal-sensitive transcriptional regulator [Sporolactobacillus sp.]|uniref:metal-sensitive transcriptional regulator n=1 Tax=Sporolactobacillus sp. STSJ-5 TaxID=2965076 RepID=UPI00210745CB|nr:metal-sensitive transcriptional regulator [Sporolactobacillus sp. STSJ-5]MCQ2008725.1 metal-sensitive transcriptional regulator [Sporolactobacillus sp. STSJ-5]
MEEYKKHCTCADDSLKHANHSEERVPLVPRTSDEKRKIANRLKRVEGQVRGIEKMVEDDRYCVDILIQLSAVQAALQKIGFSILERHTKSCVAKAIEEGHGDEQINELLKVLKHFK